MRLILIFLIAAFCYGQGTVTVGGGSGTIRNGATNPASCTAGKELFINTASTPVLKLCTAPNTWSDVGIIGAGTGDVLGAASLVSPGLVPYIASLGTLGSDSGLAFNTTTKSLGVFGPITSGQTSTYLGKLVLNGITSGTITVQPANAAGTWSMTLPASGGTNGYVLTTNGSGVTSWAAAPGDVLGGASLTTTNRVPYVSSSGTLGSDSGLSYNSSTDSLGVIGDVTIGQTSTGSGKVKFNGLTSGTVTVQPADAAGTWTMTLPTSGGTNGYVLTTDGNGVTSWAAGGGGSGGASAGASFTTQTSVTITHNWNTLYYTTGCADSSGVTVTPATTTIGLNTAVFTFDPALTGTCAATTGGGTGGAVSSVFGRTGAVVAATNDYAFTDISGTLAVNKGGTGATTAAAARVALLNSYSGNGSKCLALNSGATDTEWATCGSGGGSYTAGFGIDITGSVVSLNSATVPTRITGTASLSMSTFGSSSCEEGNITVTGAATGDEVMIGAPTGLGMGLLWSAYVSSADTVTLRVCRVAGTATISAQTFRATIIRSF